MATTLQDPFAAIAKPTPVPAANNGAAAGDPFAAIAQPAAATPPAAAGTQSGGLGAWADRMFPDNPDAPADTGAWGMARGGVKTAGRGLATFLDLASPQKPSIEFEAGYRGQHPNATPEEIQQAWKDPKTPGGAVANYLHEAANWLKTGSEAHGTWEHIGAIGEQLLEYMGAGELFKLAGGGMKAAEAAGAGSKAMGALEDLKNAQMIHATLKANPKLAGVVAMGLKAGAEQAAQTYVHTEDPKQSAIAGVLGTSLSMGVGGVQSYLSRIAPKTVTIAGEEIPALASQVNKAGQPIDTGALGAPAIAQAQQEGARNVIQNSAAQATAAALDKINKTRPVFNAIEDPARMLPAPEGSQPFLFTLEGTGAREVPEGEIAQSAAKVPGRAAFKEPQYTTASTATREPIRPGGPTAEEGQMGADIRTAGTPEAAGEKVTGGGNLSTPDPIKAESWLRQIEDFQATREYSQLPEARQAAIEAQRKALQDQLGIYWSSPYGQRFQPVDIATAAGGVRTFGDAAMQIEAAAKPVYTTLDRVSNGDFNSWKEIAKRSLKLMQSPSSEEAFQNAQAKYREAQSEINDLIDRHRGQVSTADYMTAKNAWRDASRLDELHSVFEGMTNGVTMEETDQGLTRIMTGRAKRLEAYLSDGSNREQLEQLIGKEGVTNLKRISLLLSKANTARTTQGILGNVSMELTRHLGPAVEGGGLVSFGGAAAGGALAHALGIPGYYGAIGGALGARFVLRMAATSPRIGNMVEYAARNGLSAQHYAPLIARAIAEPFQKPEQPTDETNPQPDTHVFSVSEWERNNPGRNSQAAQIQAKHMGYEVTP